MAVCSFLAVSDDSNLVAVFVGPSNFGGLSLYLRFLAPLHLSQEAHINLLWRLGTPLKGGSGSC